MLHPRVPGTLSICMIVKNEAALLGRCLASVAPAADEIVVADTGLTDATADVARSFGARVVAAPWRNDFAWARNVSLDNATMDWALWLDADDVAPPESVPRLRALKRETPDRVFGLLVRKTSGRAAPALNSSRRACFPTGPKFASSAACTSR